jgi:hypothetical protein
MRVTTMRRLGRSVNADVIVIDSIMMGDRVVMGDGKFGEVVGSWGGDTGVNWTTMGGDIVRSSLILLRLYVWLGGVIEVLQLKGVG